MTVREPTPLGWVDLIPEVKQLMEDSFSNRSPVVIHVPSHNGTGGTRLVRLVYGAFAATDEWPQLIHEFKDLYELDARRSEVRPRLIDGVGETKTIWLPISLNAGSRPRFTSSLIEAHEDLSDRIDPSVRSSVVAQLVGEDLTRRVTKQSTAQVAKSLIPNSLKPAAKILETVWKSTGEARWRRPVLEATRVLNAGVVDAIMHSLVMLARDYRVIVVLDGGTVDSYMEEFVGRIASLGATSPFRRPQSYSVAVLVTSVDPHGRLSELGLRYHRLNLPSLQPHDARTLARSLGAPPSAVDALCSSDEPIFPLEVLMTAFGETSGRTPIERYVRDLRNLNLNNPDALGAVLAVCSTDDFTAVVRDDEHSERFVECLLTGLTELSWRFDRETGHRTTVMISRSQRRACREMEREIADDETRRNQVDEYHSRILARQPETLTEVLRAVEVVRKARVPERVPAFALLLEILNSVTDEGLWEDVLGRASGDGSTIAPEDGIDESSSVWGNFVDRMLRAVRHDTRGEWFQAVSEVHGAVHLLGELPDCAASIELLDVVHRIPIRVGCSSHGLDFLFRALWPHRGDMTRDQRSLLRRNMRFSTTWRLLECRTQFERSEATAVREEVDHDSAESLQGVADDLLPSERHELGVLDLSQSSTNLLDLAQVIAESRRHLDKPEAPVVDAIKLAWSDPGRWRDLLETYSSRLDAALDGPALFVVDAWLDAVDVLSGHVRLQSSPHRVVDWRSYEGNLTAECSALHRKLHDVAGAERMVSKSMTPLVAYRLSAVGAILNLDGWVEALKSAHDSYAAQNSVDPNHLLVAGVRHMAGRKRSVHDIDGMLKRWFAHFPGLPAVLGQRMADLAVLRLSGNLCMRNNDEVARSVNSLDASRVARALRVAYPSVVKTFQSLEVVKG